MATPGVGAAAAVDPTKQTNQPYSVDGDALVRDAATYAAEVKTLNGPPNISEHKSVKGLRAKLFVDQPTLLSKVATLQTEVNERAARLPKKEAEEFAAFRESGTPPKSPAAMALAGRQTQINEASKLIGITQTVDTSAPKVETAGPRISAFSPYKGSRLGEVGKELWNFVKEKK